MSANRVARWNPDTETWEALGDGLNSSVEALATTADGSLYAGGSFTTAGGESANNVARWNPGNQTWEALGDGLNSSVEALATTADGSLYAGGFFNTAGGKSANRVARWNPSNQTWEALGSGIGNGSFVDSVRALATTADGSLYAGGQFTTAGGESANNVARWNPSNRIWEALGDGVSSIVFALATTADGSLYAGGQFTTAGGVNANNVARWNPGNQSWEMLGSGVNTFVAALVTAADNSLYVGGNFTIAGTVVSPNLAKWVPLNNPPTANAGSDQILEATSASGADVTLNASESFDDDEDDLTYSWSGPFGNESGISAVVTLPIGTSTVTLLVSDDEDSSNDTVDITVEDSTAPVISVSDVFADATGVSTAVALDTATAEDAVDGTFNATADNTGPFPLGNTTVTWTATDAAGNTSTAMQTVTVTDNGAPSVTAPEDITTQATGAATEVDIGTASATDSVDGSLTPVADNAGPYPVGSTTVTWSATDSAGNTGTATQTVTITDNEIPVVVAPADITTEATGTTTSVELGTAVAIDIVDGLLTPTPDNTGPYPPGSTTVTWSATDNAGNTGTAVQIITITDETPFVTAPANITTEATGTTTSVELGTATATDTVDGTLTPTPDNAGPYPPGLTTVTWSATDSAGNTGTAIQTITITDNETPVVTAPANITTEATGTSTSVELGSATATDTVDGALTPTPDNVGPYPPGSTTVTWSATDSAGNTGTATQTVTITDGETPFVIAPANITTEATGITTAVELGAAAAIDTVDGVLTPTPDQTGPYPVGSTTVTWSATDSAGNTGTATQTVTVTDSKTPVVTAPANITAEATGTTTSVELASATASDIVDGALTPTPDNAGPYPAGSTIVTWSATDNAGNTGTATQTVTITDGETPVVTAPANITTEATGTTTSVELGTATAFDTVDGALTPTPDNAGPYPPGSTTVTWSATDNLGNTGSATQTVTITDGETPVVIAPANITTEATGTTTSVELGRATATDTVDGVLTPTPDNAGPYPPGSTTVTWSATDSAGNTGIATQTVTITDSTTPVVTAPANITTEATGTTTSVALGTATATDIVDGVLTPTPDQPGPYPPGLTTVTWSATDSAGNTGSATQTITITENRAPVVTAPADISTQATGAVTSVFTGNATAFDTVDGTLTATPDRPGPYPVGTTIVTWSATDNNGNTGSATQTITVADNTPPIVIVPGSISVSATGATTSVDLGVAAAIDVVDGRLTATASETGPFSVGVTTIIWSATDSAGNTSTASQIVTVTDNDIPVVTETDNDIPVVAVADNDIPVVTAPPDISVEAFGETTFVDLGTAIAIDAADGNLTPVPDSTGPYPVGTSTVTWSAVDSAGNIGTATQLVTILDVPLAAAATDIVDNGHYGIGSMSPVGFISIGLVCLFARRRAKSLSVNPDYS